MATSEPQQTAVLREREKVSAALIDFFKKARLRLDICAVTMMPSQPEPIEGQSKAYLDIKRRGGALRLLTDITKENSPYIRQVSGQGIEVRHLSGMGGNFAISDDEYVATLGTEEFNPRGSLLLSNEKLFVEHHKRLFDLLWDGAIPAEQRLVEIERGIPPSKIEVLYDPKKIEKLYLDLVRQARNEVLLLMPSANAFRRQEDLGVIDQLGSAARKSNIKVRVLSPVDSEVEKRIAAEHGKSPIEFRGISPAESTSVIIAIVDRKHVFIIEKNDNSASDFLSAIGAATYSNRAAMVMSNVWLFGWLWNEASLVEQQTRDRIQVQTNALRSSLAWEITPANYKCARCGREVEMEIRVYDPRMMPSQSKTVSTAMKQNNAGWIPFCFYCISNHPYSKPSWLISE